MKYVDYYTGVVEMAEDEFMELYNSNEYKNYSIPINEYTWPWFYLLIAAMLGEI
jgi:hypothetical protein